MVRTPRQKCESNIYHVVTRGVGRQIIFEDDRDRLKFRFLMEEFAQREVMLYAWCLMDNHVHLLMRGEIENISESMKLTLTSYSLWFNRRHGRAGHLFQNRFNSECVEDDAYFLVVIRYIHQNPIKAGISTTCDYRWSSYSEYCNGAKICDTNYALGIFGGLSGFLSFHERNVSDSCLDIPLGRSRTRGLPDVVALGKAQEIIGSDSLFCVAAFERGERDAALRSLREAGLTVRQIERFTGIPKSTIHRVC